MTDNDIIKALECCSDAEDILVKGETYKAEPLSSLFKDAIDLINRQKAEYQKLQSVLDEILVNERCNYENKIAELVTQKEWYKRQYNGICDNASLMGYESIVEKARAEAITEFEERLKEDISNHRLEMYMNGLKGTPRTQEITYECVEEYIDQIAKEMKGEQ